VALVHYKEHLKISPDNSEVRSQLGLCQIFLGDIDVGEETIYSAYQANQTNATCLKNQGVLNLYKGNISSSLKYLLKAKEIMANTNMIDFYLAYTYKKLNKDKEFQLYKSKHTSKNAINNSIFEW
jgi:Flp pilus assembly protein TadD